ncbi:hypothetical protein [Nocardioides sp.]|uniref:hypothetical protein n=1 Tax=Nocardioides sp. TaxID=35761 RepID=UPI002B26FFC4|nr:hypothetical protein [Nocardioides sp.]
MREQTAALAPVAVLVGALGLCCGLPVLLSLGVVGAIAGWSLQSLVLVGMGLALAAVGGLRYLRHLNSRRRTSQEEVSHDADL